MQIIASKNARNTLILLFAISYHAVAQVDDCGTETSLEQQQRRVIRANLAGIGVVTAWGIAKWDYFSNSPKATSEGWFQNDTDSGGADKLGHLYTSYVTAHGLSYLYETWCINKDDAALYGALSSLMILGYMEAGDSFSPYGFSKEDFIANSVGSLLGYYLYLKPDWASKIDLRWEYGFHPNHSDFTTDYENSKYLLALKLNGFEYFRSSFLKHIEIHAGYYSRGFSDHMETRERNLYVGIGLNLTDLLRRHDYRKTSTLLRYIQIPGTYVEFEKDMNK
ncbi:MAG: DUF2279 domain-containing protein [Gammaproteobacteria bacterium]|nr:DUF2279 domain-containing protein [Gammaproteobacteria bacterium]